MKANPISDDFILQCICGRSMTQIIAGDIYTTEIECSECFAKIGLKSQCFHCFTVRSVVHNIGTMDVCSECTKTRLQATMQYPRFLRKKQQASMLDLFSSKKFSDLTIIANGKPETRKLILPQLTSDQPEKLSDAGLIVDEAEPPSTFECHRMVMSSVCDEFRNRLMPEDIKQWPSKVEFSDISAQSMECIVRFAYVNDPKITAEKILPLMKVCQTYGITALSELCEELLEQVFLTPDNFCAVLSAIFENGLGKQCSLMIRKFMKTYTDYSLAIAKSSSFNEMCIEALQFFLELDHVQIREEKVWTFVIGWAQQQSGEMRADLARKNGEETKEPEKNNINDYDGSDPIIEGSRRFYLSPLVEYMRFGLMDARFFVNQVIPENVLSNEQIITCLQYFHAPDMGCGEFFVDPRSTTLGTKLIEDRVCVTRGEFSRAGVENQWNYNGIDKDAIAFTTDTTIMLESIGVFCGKGKSTVQGWVYRGDNGESEEGGHVVATSAKTDFQLEEANIEPLKLMLPNLLKVYRNVKYTIEILQKNETGEKSSWVRYSKPVTETEQGVMVKWQNANSSPNRTDMVDGAVPCIYGYTIEGVNMDDDIDPDGLGNEGDFKPAMIERGEIDGKPAWTCTGKVKDAICITVDKPVSLDGVGILCGAQKTSVVCKVYKGRSQTEKDCLVTIEDNYQRESPNVSPIQLSFKESIDLEKNQIYTIELTQTNSRSRRCCRIVKGKEEVTFEEGPFTVKFSDAKDSANGTDISTGAIPTLYMKYSKEVWLADLGHTGRITVNRGTAVAPTPWRWDYDGTKKDAMRVQVDGELSLLGIGIFCATEGVTKAQACVIKGDNISDVFTLQLPLEEKEKLKVECETKMMEFEHKGKATDITELLFEKTVKLKPGVDYTIELLQQNCAKIRSGFTFGSKQKIKVSGVNIFFSDAKYSPNSTDDSEGAFPMLIVRADGGEGDSAPGSVIDKMEPIIVKRGDYSSADWRWRYRGGPDKRDAIAFECDKEFLLRGVGVFPGKGTTKVQIKIVKGTNKEGSMLSYVAQSALESLSFPAKHNDAIEVKLESPLMCEAGQKYTAEVHQSNEGSNESFFISSGKRSLTVEGFTFQFESANYSPNGTDVGDGGIPTLYVIDPAKLGGSMASVLALGAVGPQIVLKRGDWEEASWRWNYSGSVSALKVKIDQKVVLEGIGVFPGQGKTTVSVRIIEGDNTSDPSDCESRVVGSADEQELNEESKPSEPKMVALTKPAVLEAGKEYTIELKQKNEDDKVSSFVARGKPRYEVDGLTIELSRASYSPNGTDVSDGALPTLYFRRTSLETKKAVDYKAGIARTTPAAFKLERGECREAGMRWVYEGDKKDALCVSVDKPVALFGVGVFVGAKDSENEVVIYKGDNDEDEKKCEDRIISRSTKMTYSRRASNLEPLEAGLNPPFIMEAGEKYTIEVRQTNASREPSCFVDACKPTMNMEGIEFTFSDAAFSNNGTSVNGGSIPTLYWSQSDASLAPSLNGDFSISRGDSEGDFDWTYSGTKDSVAFKASHSFALCGVGLFLPESGPCTAIVRLVAGMNDEENTAEVLCMVGPREITGTTHGDRTKPYRLDFLDPFAIEPDTLYTLELQQTNFSGESCRVSSGVSTVSKEGLSITFLTSGFSPNGTTVEDGAFPLLFGTREADSDAPSLPEPKLVDIDDVAPCKCGANMTRVAARLAYGAEGGIGCDKCRASIGGHFVVYHCPDGRTSEHPGGYDLCLDCARATAKELADKPKEMFTLSRGTTSGSPSWTFIGAKNRDAIAFTSDRSFVLRGVGVFLGGEGRTEAQAFVFKGDHEADPEGGELLSSSVKISESRGTAPKAPFELSLTKPILVEPMVKYTVEIRQQNHGTGSYFSQSAASSTVEPGVCKVTWESSKFGNNGTNQSSGAVPCLYCMPAESWDDVLAAAEAEEKKDVSEEPATDNPNDEGKLGENEFVIMRGSVSDFYDWQHDGEKDDAIGMICNYDALIHGFGVFVARDGDCEVYASLMEEGVELANSGTVTLNGDGLSDRMKPVKVSFTESVAIKGGVKYDLLLKQKNVSDVPSSSIDEGILVGSRRGVEINFVDSELSENGSNVTWGAIPCVYLTKTGEVAVKVERPDEEKVEDLASAASGGASGDSDATKAGDSSGAGDRSATEMAAELSALRGMMGAMDPASAGLFAMLAGMGLSMGPPGGGGGPPPPGGGGGGGPGGPPSVVSLSGLLGRADGGGDDAPVSPSAGRSLALRMLMGGPIGRDGGPPDAGGPPPPAAAAGEPWACPMCTYLNPGHARQCEMCFSARP